VRQLEDTSAAGPGIKSAIYLFTRWWLLVPGLIGTVVFGAWLYDVATTNGKPIGPELLLIAPLVGFGFGVMIGLPGFFLSRAMKKTTPFVPAEGEPVVHRTRANHFLGAEGRGGHLVLTDRRLVFEPHRFNVQLAPLEIPLAAIDDVAWNRVVARQGLVMSMMLHVTTDGAVERFVVPEANAWAKRVAEAR
jgi:hypothetical protein